MIDTPNPTDTAPHAASPPRDQADELLTQMEAGAALASQVTQAVQQAASAASQIVSDIHAADSAIPAPSPLDTTRTPVAHRQAKVLPPTEEIRRLLNIEVPIIVQLGVRRMTVGEVMRLSVGAIVEFQKAADDELELLANNKIIGKGQAVKVGENFGIKLTAIGPLKETIRLLGA